LHEKKVKQPCGTQQIGWFDTFIQTFTRFYFSNFPIVLHEWLSQLATQHKEFQGGELKEWTPFLIERLKRLNNLYQGLWNSD